MGSSDAGTAVPKSRWRRWLVALAALEEAVSLYPEGIQNRRIAKLEAQLAELQAKLVGSESGSSVPPS